MVGPNFRVGKKIGCGNFGELRLGLFQCALCRVCMLVSICVCVFMLVCSECGTKAVAIALCSFKCVCVCILCASVCVCSVCRHC